MLLKSGFTILLNIFINVYFVNTLTIVPCTYEDMKKYTELCASNGKTYNNICDFRQDKLFFNPKLVLLTSTRCPESMPPYIDYDAKLIPKPGDNLHFNIEKPFQSDMNQNIEETIGILQDYSKLKEKRKLIHKVSPEI